MATVLRMEKHMSRMMAHTDELLDELLEQARMDLDVIDIEEFVFGSYTDEEIVDALHEDGLSIIHVRKPSLEMQLAAVKNDPMSITYIRDPAYEVQLEAIERDGLLLPFIRKPSYEIRRAAVRNNPLAIYHVHHHPSDNLR